jgi:hypothetical protein
MKQLRGMCRAHSTNPSVWLLLLAQVEPETAAALQRASAASACCQGAGAQLLFRDFCEVLVRVTAARYPLLPSLEMQVQQVLSYHLLPLLVGTARHPAARASVVAAAAAVAAAALVDVPGGCWEQQLRASEVVQYLRGHRQLLEQLFRAFAAAGDSGSAYASTQQDVPAAAGVDGTEQGSSHELSRQQQPVLVCQVVARLQETVVLEPAQLSMEAAAACLLHSALAVTDPQGVR